MPIDLLEVENTVRSMFIALDLINNEFDFFLLIIFSVDPIVSLSADRSQLSSGCLPIIAELLCESNNKRIY